VTRAAGVPRASAPANDAAGSQQAWLRWIRECSAVHGAGK